MCTSEINSLSITSNAPPLFLGFHSNLPETRPQKPDTQKLATANFEVQSLNVCEQLPVLYDLKPKNHWVCPLGGRKVAYGLPQEEKLQELSGKFKKPASQEDLRDSLT